MEMDHTETTDDKRVVIFFGNSITAGFGLEESQAFPALIQDKIDSLDLPFRVVNAGLSGETTAGGKNRISWILKQPVDIFVLELGANDGLRGIDLSETESNLQAILDSVTHHYPEASIMLTGMEVPPNMGPEYSQEFREIFQKLAEKNDVVFLPFILKGVGGEPSLNLADGIHPNQEGHRIIAGHVWKELYPMIKIDIK